MTIHAIRDPRGYIAITGVGAIIGFVFVALYHGFGSVQFGDDAEENSYNLTNWLGIIFCMGLDPYSALGLNRLL
jgi:choline-glycine betaine transporter